MLRVSRKSWHYRLWRFYHESGEPKNLCRYFWANVFGIVIPLAVSLLALTGIGALLWIMGTHAKVTGIILGSITLLIVILVVAVIGISKLVEWAFIKAKKQKVCPLIKVVD